jgi:hypothetical protein
MESVTPVSAAAHDRGTGLALFGILDIVIGLVYLAKAVVFLLLAISGTTTLATSYGMAAMPATALLALVPAAFFIAIGFGSMLARRWARSLSLAFSSLWLAFGVVALAFLFSCLPRIYAALRPVMAKEGAAMSPESRTYLVLLLIGLILPGAFVLFYRSESVKAECERRDPEERWTDRVPGPVVAVMMLLVVAAMLAIELGFSLSRQRILFDHPLGAGFRLGIAIVAVVELLSAWGLFRMKRWAWHAAVAITAARGIADIAIAWSVTRRPWGALVASLSRGSPQAASVTEALRPLHLFRQVTLFIAVVSLLAFSLVIWVGRWFRREER